MVDQRSFNRTEASKLLVRSAASATDYTLIPTNSHASGPSASLVGGLDGINGTGHLQVDEDLLNTPKAVLSLQYSAASGRSVAQ